MKSKNLAPRTSGAIWQVAATTCGAEPGNLQKKRWQPAISDAAVSRPIPPGN